MSQNILDRILETKRKELASLRRGCSLDELKSAASAADRPRNFFAAVTAPARRRVNLIAEVKKASPSAGVICDNFDPAEIARLYERAGAAAVSVLTDETYFQGSADYLRAVREAVGLPVLRKDFIIDPAQVYESRAMGADAILLIAAALPASELGDLMNLATELRMTSLVEVHGADEILQVRSIAGFPHPEYSLLGINNRDLTTFHVDVASTVRLTPLAGGKVPIVSESGIRTSGDVARLADAGVSAILVGETLMRAPDIDAAVEELLGPETTDKHRITNDR